MLKDIINFLLASIYSYLSHKMFVMFHLHLFKKLMNANKKYYFDVIDITLTDTIFNIVLILMHSQMRSKRYI